MSRRLSRVVRREALWRGAGLAIPVFSLRTRHSCGAGEFLDLIPLVDFANRWELSVCLSGVL
jgi:4-alpha-glucanotransferase